MTWPPRECVDLAASRYKPIPHYIGGHPGRELRIEGCTVNLLSDAELVAAAMAAALEGAASNVEQRVERCRAAENFAPAVFLGEVEDWLRSRAAAYARPEEHQPKESP